jgi:peptidoglycan/xylan/chitin deacetylase (PgdA/CDA1 family)
VNSLPQALIAAGGTLAAATAFCAYAGLSDESQLFGRSLVSPPEPDQFALTFDDGPNPNATPRLLEVLARHNARATFFLIGDYVRREPGLTRELLAAGHTVGNHTMHHLWLARHPEAVIREEMQTCNKVLEDTLGEPVRLFRPPHGARRPSVFRVAHELGLEVVQWNLMVGDWKPRTAEDLAGRIGRGMKFNRWRGRGTNLVLHDGSQHVPDADRGATIGAVERVLQSPAAGTRLVTPPGWR